MSLAETMLVTQSSEIDEKKWIMVNFILYPIKRICYPLCLNTSSAVNVYPWVSMLRAVMLLSLAHLLMPLNKPVTD